MGSIDLQYPVIRSTDVLKSCASEKSVQGLTRIYLLLWEIGILAKRNPKSFNVQNIQKEVLENLPKLDESETSEESQKRLIHLIQEKADQALKIESESSQKIESEIPHNPWAIINTKTSDTDHLPDLKVIGGQLRNSNRVPLDSQDLHRLKEGIVKKTSFFHGYLQYTQRLQGFYHANPKDEEIKKEIQKLLNQKNNIKTSISSIKQKLKKLDGLSEGKTKEILIKTRTYFAFISSILEKELEALETITHPQKNEAAPEAAADVVASESERPSEAAANVVDPESETTSEAATDVVDFEANTHPEADEIVADPADPQSETFPTMADLAENVVSSADSTPEDVEIENAKKTMTWGEWFASWLPNSTQST